MSSYSENSRGVIILINNTPEYETGRIIKDQNGNFIVIELTVADKEKQVAQRATIAHLRAIK